MTYQHNIVETSGVDVVADRGCTQSKGDGAEGRGM
jgi:hypothetical protein